MQERGDVPGLFVHLNLAILALGAPTPPQECGRNAVALTKEA